MLRKKKAQVIDTLKEVIDGCDVGILTDYRGITAQEMTVLRRVLRQADVDFRVVKNTLARFAVQRAGRDDLAGIFEGPVAVAFGYGDITRTVKVLDGYIRDSKIELSIKAGFLKDRRLTLEELKVLATLPSREVLVARVVGGMQSPITALARILTAPMQGIVGLLQARIRQLEGG